MEALFHLSDAKVNQYENPGHARALMESAGVAKPAPMSRAAQAAPASLSSTPVRSPVKATESCGSCCRCRRDNPQAVLVLTGCMPQAFPGGRRRDGGGGRGAQRVPAGAARPGGGEYLLRHQRVVDIGDHASRFESYTSGNSGTDPCFLSRSKTGANRFCSYCIIPTPGPGPPKPLEELAEELRDLAEKGYAEVVMSGINLTAYGQEWGGSSATQWRPPAPYRASVGCGWVRWKPDMLDEAAVDRLAAQEKLCPQFPWRCKAVAMRRCAG